MAGSDVGGSSATYSPLTGMVFIFNLIVGTGALALPKAFATAGWLAGGVTIVCLAFLSFVTVSYVVEAMSTTNALVKRGEELLRRKQLNGRRSSVNYDAAPGRLLDGEGESESSPLIRSPADSIVGEGVFSGELRFPGGGAPAFAAAASADSAAAPPEPDAAEPPFEITRRFELGQMAQMYFSRYLIVGFYAVICVYLYGDLAIYAVAVPRSLRDVACVYGNASGNDKRNDSDACWSPGVAVSRADAYRLFVAVFALTVCPFAFFNVQKTKYLQVATTLSRWLAFAVMLTLATVTIASGQGSGRRPPMDLARIPRLFGASVYSFMCHHSLPALLTPMSPKRSLRLILMVDFGLIMLFYLSLAYTGIFAFDTLEDLYTLNFQPGRPMALWVWPPVQYFLVLFPVFALSTSFPIIAITLCGNLRSLVGLCRRGQRGDCHWLVDRVAYPMVAVGPPIAVAFAISSVDLLVAYTGSYAGALLQYAVPALLLYFSRRRAASQLPPADADPRYAPRHVSPFGHPLFIGIILAWTLACMALVTADHLLGQTSDSGGSPTPTPTPAANGTL